MKSQSKKVRRPVSKTTSRKYQRNPFHFNTVSRNPFTVHRDYFKGNDCY